MRALQLEWERGRHEVPGTSKQTTAAGPTAAMSNATAHCCISAPLCPNPHPSLSLELEILRVPQNQAFAVVNGPGWRGLLIGWGNAPGLPAAGGG